MGSIKLPHASGNSMSIAAPATNPASDLELKLPATIGTAGQVLSVDGSGNLVWTDNGPMFLAKLFSDWSHTSHNNFLTVPCATEAFDTANAYNTSTYTFTVPSGKGGKYYFYWAAQVSDNPDEGEYITGRLNKNGSAMDYSWNSGKANANNQTTDAAKSFVVEVAAGDEIKYEQWQNSGGNATYGGPYTFFGGYRLIGG